MAIKIKSKTLVGNKFGILGDFGGIANNSILKRNPHLLKLLMSKSERTALRKIQLPKVRSPKNIKASKIGGSKYRTDATNKDKRENKPLNNTNYCEASGLPVEQDILEIPTVGNNQESSILSNIESNKLEKLDEVVEGCSNHDDKYDKEFYCIRWNSRDGSKYYKIYIQPTLLGNYTLTKCWGGVGNNLGGSQMKILESLADIDREVSNIDKQRKRRGYVLTDGVDEA